MMVCAKRSEAERITITPSGFCTCVLIWSQETVWPLLLQSPNSSANLDSVSMSKLLKHFYWTVISLLVCSDLAIKKKIECFLVFFQTTFYILISKSETRGCFYKKIC